MKPNFVRELFMRTLRPLTVAALLALTLAACGGEQSAVAGALVYQYESGDELSYAIELDQVLTATTEVTGAAAAFTDDEVPGEMDITTSIRGTVTYQVAEGPEAGTWELGISGDFEDFQVSGTVDGEEIDEDMAGDFDLGPQIAPPDLSMVVDEKGNIISMSLGGEALMTSLADPFSMLQETVGNNPLEGHFGPAFPEEELSVGDSWTSEESAVFGEQTITTTSTHEVVAIEELDGREVVVINTTVETSAFELSFGDILTAFMTGFAEGFAELGGAPDADVEEIREQLGGIDFTVSSDPTTAETRAWFDNRAGVVRKTQGSTEASLLLRLRFPDDASGELVGFDMDMGISMDFAVTLQDG